MARDWPRGERRGSLPVMLHVHGGSVVLEQLRAAGLPGEFLEWVDVLCQGPLPAGADGAAWLDTRAAFLDAAYAADGARARLAAQDHALAQALAEHDEIVLWFSADWFCQAILLCLLTTRLPERNSGLLLISLGAYPGVSARGCTLAFLSSEQLRDVFARRAPVGPGIFAAARRAWDAVRSPDPAAVQAALGGIDALPFAADGLARHLREFPAPRTGVNRTEARVLAAVRDAPQRFGDLFPRVTEQEERPWITDLIFADVLRRLAAGRRPLIAPEPAHGLRATAGDALRPVRIALTDDGRAVLDGVLDWITAAGVDRWVGGVHLAPDNDWRWDEARSTVARAPQSS